MITNHQSGVNKALLTGVYHFGGSPLGSARCALDTSPFSRLIIVVGLWP